MEDATQEGMGDVNRNAGCGLSHAKALVNWGVQYLGVQDWDY